MTIDPYETIITYLLSKSDLTDIVGTRISVKHKYGYDWGSSDTGLVVSPNGGLPDLYVEVQRPTIQFRIYADDVQKAMSVWKVLNNISRETEREVVTTLSGDGMIYWLNPISGPALITDNELEKDIVLINFDTQVAEVLSS